MMMTDLMSWWSEKMLAMSPTRNKLEFATMEMI
jgi:hypothetical protein